MEQNQNNHDIYSQFKTMSKLLNRMSNFALVGWGLAIILLNVVFRLLEKLGVF